MHHLLVKGALFLGVAEWERVGSRPWVLTGLGLLALTMAGAPLTGGAAAKSGMDDALASAGADLSLLFFLSATGTVLLMTRFLWLVVRAEHRVSNGFDGASLNWLLLAALALWLPFGLAELSSSSAGLIPLAVGLAMAALVWAATRGRSRPQRGIPPGDILYLVPRRRLRRLLWTRRRPYKGPGYEGPGYEGPGYEGPGYTGRGFSLDWRPVQANGRTLSLATAGLLWLSVFVLVLSAVLMLG
jgi:hypothetical protein